MDVNTAYSRPIEFNELANRVLDSDGLQNLFPFCRLTKKAYTAIVEAFEMRLIPLRAVKLAIAAKNYQLTSADLGLVQLWKAATLLPPAGRKWLTKTPSKSRLLSETKALLICLEAGVSKDEIRSSSSVDVIP